LTEDRRAAKTIASMAEPEAGLATAPARASRGRRILATAVVAYLAALLLVWALLRFYADVWWPATLLLYGPRWICALPLAALAPLAAMRSRRLLAPLSLAALVVVFPILGLNVAALHRAASAPAEPTSTPPRHVRLMTYNVGDDSSSGADLFRLLDQISPDIVAIQECSAIGRVSARQPGLKYIISAWGDGCLMSRSPIERTEIKDPEAIKAIGGTGTMIRYTVHLPEGDVQIVNMHLATVREGLTAVAQRGLGGVPTLKANIETRWAMSAMGRAFVDATPQPFLVAGDFNLPSDSAIYRRDWASLPSAFEVAGNGFGTSKRTGWFGVRIDHILLGPGWTCERAFIGPHLHGDHRPLVADLTWSG
jgi:endonuclease/exonuclease/phosphatase (EEP) superfamily protein YafD